MNVNVSSDYEAVSGAVAARIAQLIREKPDAVLGLATGSTPLGVYAELIRMHREESLDFSRVTTFNLDEYLPMQPDAPQSYVRFMRENLFDYLNCENYHIPDGTLHGDEEISAFCENYERQIADAGGLDLQLLGIGRTGHIGFNEPGSGKDSRTRMVVLDSLTRADAADDFFGLENVPVRAITMGNGTILSAREIILMASGAKKADIVQEALEGKITSKVPASFLRDHANATFFLDEAAASHLREYSQPWRAPDADLTDFALRRRAFLTVALNSEKPLGKLSPADFERHGGARVLAEVPSLEAAAQEVENDLKSRLDDDAHLPRGKNIFCLSPHPDDDVICCGATLLKLARRDNNVTVAYGVSGSQAVRDKDVLALLRARHPRLISFIENNAEPGKSVEDIFNEVRSFIFDRAPGQPDAPLLRDFKRLVREGEAADACRKMGAKPLFLNLPFYETGKVAKSPITQTDVRIMKRALEDTTPDIVMLTGELNDPHGTHEMCAQAFDGAAREYSQNGDEPFARWYYRGAWNEYEAWEGDYFSIFGKAMMEEKVGLILDHISQLDPVYPGETDPREFYERARDRNRATARQLQTLGVLPPSRSFDPLYAEVFQTKK